MIYRLILLLFFLLVSIPFSFALDGTFVVQNGDILTATNGHYITFDSKGGVSQSSVTFSVDKSPGGHSLVVGETKRVSASPVQPSTLRVTLNSISQPHASVTIESLTTTETPPVPEASSQEMTSDDVYRGDGTFTLSVGDTVIPENGVQIILQNVNEGTSYGRDGNPIHKKFAILKVTGANGELILNTGELTDIITVDEGADSLGNFQDIGLKVETIAVDVGSKTALVRVASVIERKLFQGWNLLSIPLRADNCKGECFGEVDIRQNSCGELTFWAWTGQTFEKTLPSPGNGFWVKAQQDCSLTFGGSRITDWSRELRKGWNIIGGPTSFKRLSDLRGTCDIPFVWQYDVGMNRFVEAQFFGNTEGMFVNVGADCEVIV